MPDSRRYDDWYNKAKIDLRSAEILAEHDGDNEVIAFHCQQAIEKALKSLREPMELWLESAIEHNDNIPLPKAENDYSGKFLVRIPKTLHRQLSQKAEEEGISLNQYALYKLST